MTILVLMSDFLSFHDLDYIANSEHLYPVAVHNSSPTTHREAVWKDGPKILQKQSLPECITSSGDL